MLLEMTIAIGLTAVLLAILFRFLVSNAKFERKVDLASAIVLERERIVERLDTVLTNLQPLDTGGPLFYTAQFPDDSIAQSLVVSFNAGIDPDPEYSSIVTGRIYVTEAGELILGYWPVDKKGYRTEVLLQNVHDLEWQFLGQKLDKDPKTPIIAGSWAWLRQWPKTQSRAPEIIRLRLWCGQSKKKQPEPNLQFAFILPVLTPINMVK
jgi:hypothetical protein